PLSGKKIADDPLHLDIVRRQVMCTGLSEPCGVSLADMSCREQPDHRGACSPSRNDAVCAVFDDNAIARSHADFRRRMQENVRVRLASRNAGGTEHSNFKELRHVKNLKTDGEPVWRGGRCDAARQIDEFCDELTHARNRRKLLPEPLQRLVLTLLTERLRQRP